MLNELGWGWDVDVFDELSGGCCLSMLFLRLVESDGLLTELHLSRSRMCAFLDEVQRGYGNVRTKLGRQRR